MKYRTLVALFFLAFVLPSSLFAQDLRMQRPTQSVEPAANPSRVQPTVTPPTMPSVAPRVAPPSASPVNRRASRAPANIAVLPDLSILSLSIVPARINAGDQARLTATVKNNGDHALSGIKVQFLDGRNTIGENVLSLAARATGRVETRVPLQGNGRITIIAMVDPDGHITESNEQNNKAQSQITISQKALASKNNGEKATVMAQTPSRPLGGKAMPGNHFSTPVPTIDLLPVTLTVNQDHAIIGRSVIAQATIKNFGRTDLVDIPVAFFLDRQPLGEQIVSLPGNSGRMVTFRFTAKQAGQHNLSVFVDPANMVDERNEHNNSTHTPLIIERPALALQEKAIVVVNPVTGSLKKLPAKPSAPTLPKQTSGTTQRPDMKQAFRTPSGSMDTRDDMPKPDLICSIETKDGVYHGDGAGIRLRIDNFSTTTSGAFTVGFGVKKKVKIFSANHWLGTLKVPKVFGQQHLYVTIPWHTQTLTPSTLIAAVDINGDVDESVETNNYSAPFDFQTSPGSIITPPPLPAEPPTEAFDIKTPNHLDRFSSRDDIAIRWYTKQAVVNLPAEGHPAFWELEIFLVDSTTGKKVIKLAEDVRNRPLGPLMAWNVSLPTATPAGTYHLLLSTPSGSGWGKSESFTVYQPKVAEMAGISPSSTLDSGATVNPAAIKSIETTHGDKQPLDLSVRFLDATLQHEPHGAGQPRKLKSVTARYEITSDQDFKFGPTNDPLLGHVSIGETLFFGMYWLKPGENFDHYVPYTFRGYPGVVFSPQEVYTKGKSVISVTFYPHQLLGYQNTSYPFCPITVKSTSNQTGKTSSDDYDFWVVTGILLQGQSGSFGERVLEVVGHEKEPRAIVWPH